MINKLFVFSVCLSKVILRGGNTKYVFVSLDDSLIFQQTDVEITFYKYNSVPFYIYIALLKISSSFYGSFYISAYLN